MPKPISRRLPLDDSDLQNLRESGLTDATIRANAIRTENSALVFPYRDINGVVNCFTRWRPHTPRLIDGKPAKYEQPKNSPLRAYFPSESIERLRDISMPVFITEGEKKALALAQCGLAAVGLGGVWCGCKKKSTELIDDLQKINWSGRDVYVIFDYDEKPTTRRQVDAARRRLASALRAAGAREVYNVELPPGREDLE